MSSSLYQLSYSLLPYTYYKLNSFLFVLKYLKLIDNPLSLITYPLFPPDSPPPCRRLREGIRAKLIKKEVLWFYLTPPLLIGGRIISDKIIKIY